MDLRLRDEWVDARAAVLVEGASDQCAVQTVAERSGVDLGAAGVAVVPMGGATNIVTFLDHFGPRGRDLRLAGLCDSREERGFRRALERAGFGPIRDRDELEALGFYVCDADLEDELIRAVGVAGVEAIVAAEHELGPWRTFQKQPAQQGRAIEAQLRRFMGSRSGRKLRYARLLAGAVDLARVPRPLRGLLAAVT